MVSFDATTHITTSQSSPKTLVLRILLSAILLFVLLVAAFMRWLGFGWFLLICGIPYLAIFLLHTACHIVPIIRAAQSRPILLALVFVSHLCFIGGFLLQLDQGDGPHPYLTLTNVTWDLLRWPPPAPGAGAYAPNAPAWIAQLNLLWNLLVLLPTLISWPFLFLPRLYNPRKSTGKSALSFGIGMSALFALGLLAMLGFLSRPTVVASIESARDQARATTDDALTSAIYPPDGQYLVTASENGVTRIWQVSTAKP